MNHYAFTYTSEAPRGLPQVVAANRLEYLDDEGTPMLRLLITAGVGTAQVAEHPVLEVPAAMLCRLSEHPDAVEAFRSLTAPAAEESPPTAHDVAPRLRVIKG